MTASIHDVANRAGVSIATVSRVINKSAGVSQKKVEAVKEALEYFKYQPSQFGRGLVTGNSNLIGVYSPTNGKNMFSNGYMLECLRGISEEIGETKYGMLLLSEGEHAFTEKNQKPKFSDYIHQNKIDGLICLSAFPYKNLLKEMEADMDSGFPIAYVGRKFHEGGMNVYAGYDEYMEKAIDKFYECGHRRIAILPLDSHSEGIERLKKRVARKYSDVTLDIKSLTVETNLDTLTAFLKRTCVENKTTALLCESIDLVLKVQNILNVLNLEIGKDVSVISIEHIKDQGERMYPQISCFYVPAFDIGKQIAQSMLNHLKGETPESNEIIIQPTYMDRGSVVEINH